MLKKLRDRFDTKVSEIILVDDAKKLEVLKFVFKAIDEKRIKYCIYKDTDLVWMVEYKMPYNRYLAMMQELHKQGLNLQTETAIGLFSKLIKYSK